MTGLIRKIGDWVKKKRIFSEYDANSGTLRRRSLKTNSLMESGMPKSHRKNLFFFKLKAMTRRDTTGTWRFDYWMTIMPRFDHASYNFNDNFFLRKSIIMKIVSVGLAFLSAEVLQIMSLAFIVCEWTFTGTKLRCSFFTASRLRSNAVLPLPAASTAYDLLVSTRQNDCIFCRLRDSPIRDLFTNYLGRKICFENIRFVWVM